MFRPSKCRQVNTSRCHTLARPDIADYPFSAIDAKSWGRAGKYSSEATLVDLPGLIEGSRLKFLEAFKEDACVGSCCRCTSRGLFE
ncbi:hypothetical protein V6N11_052972 [Hibiscus sabdariffa]|uniref:Uncharacterized protein n=1 Tax=Hibiscus sabdariffa TaxID=183260 RepID=A0ABR2UBQ0_9ROSI